MKLLFLCTHNSCRSILAEAIARQQCGILIDVQSAGLTPARKVHPLTLEQLAMHDIPLRGLRSKSWQQLEGFCPDFIVKLGDMQNGDECTLGDGSAVHIQWPLPDPTRLDDDYDACWLCFDEVIATLTQRLQRLGKLLQQQAAKHEIQYELQNAAMLFAMPASRTPKRPALDLMMQWGTSAVA